MGRLLMAEAGSRRQLRVGERPGEEGSRAKVQRPRQMGHSYSIALAELVWLFRTAHSGIAILIRITGRREQF